LTTFSLGNYALLAVGIGFLLYSFGKKRNTQYLGSITLGFGLVFIGLKTLTTAMQPLAETILRQGTLTRNPVYPLVGYFLGFLATALVQNNVATLGVLQAIIRQVALSGQESPFLHLPTVLPLLLGAGLGLSVTATIAAVKGNLQTKRAAWAHWLITGTTSLSLLFLLGPLARVVNWATLQLWRLIESGKEFILSVPAGSVPTGAPLLIKEIAIAHTLTNLLMVLIWLPLATPLSRFLTARITGVWRPQEEESVDREYLNERFYSTPGLALRVATKEIIRTGQIAIDMLYFAKVAFFKGQSSAIRDIEKKEDIVDELRNKITQYLTTLLSRGTLTVAESRYLAGLIHVINDVERIADHAEHVGEFAQAKLEEKLPFSQLAMDELGLLYDKVLAICKKALVALEEDDPVLAKQVMERETVIDKIQKEMRQNHINRLNQGRCWPGSGIIYLELIATLERVADHAANITEVVLVGKEELI
jgi:phosphate:Na+ symporter